MTIEKKISDIMTVLKINGRLDTTTAPELEAVIDGCVEGTGTGSGSAAGASGAGPSGRPADAAERDGI